MNNENDERRIHHRYDTSIAAEIYTDHDVYPVSTANVSAGGVAINSKTPLEKGTQIGISLFLVEEGIEDETSSPLNVQGQIMWTEQNPAGEYEAGVKFAPLTPQQTFTLEYFLQRLKS